MSVIDTFDRMNDLAMERANISDEYLNDHAGESLLPVLANTMGVCVAVWAGYRGDMIMEVAIAALEEANYHGEAAQLQEMLEVG